GVGATPHVASYVKDADLVLLCATVAPWHPASAAPAPGTKIAVVSDNPFRSELPFHGYAADLVVQGDVEASLAMLVQRVASAVPSGSRALTIGPWRARHQKRRAAIEDEGKAVATHTPIDTRWVVHQLNQILPDGAIVVDETITHRLHIHRFLDRLAPGGFF